MTARAPLHTLLVGLALATACRSVPAPDPLTHLPADAKAVVGLTRLPALKQAIFGFCFTVPGLEGIADGLVARFGLDPAGDTEGDRLGLALDRPVALVLRGPFWLLALPLDDPARFQGWLADRLRQEGFDATGVGRWTRGQLALAAHVHEGIAWLGRGRTDSLTYLADELEAAATGPRRPALDLPEGVTAAVEGDWMALMGALDPLAPFAGVPLAARSILYGFGALRAELRFGREGASIHALVAAGGNASLVATLGAGGPARSDALAAGLTWAPVASAALRVDPAPFRTLLPEPARSLWDGSLSGSVGVPASPARLLRSLLDAPGRFPWDELPWALFAGRRPGATLDGVENPPLLLPFATRWQDDGLLISSRAKGRGQAGRPELALEPTTVLSLDLSFRAVYEALRETDLMPYALRLLSGPRHMRLRVDRVENALDLRLELTL